MHEAVRAGTPMKEPRDELHVAAFELRMLGVDARIVRHYLYCGDDSVLSMLEMFRHNVELHGEAWALERANAHLRYVEKAGELK